MGGKREEKLFWYVLNSGVNTTSFETPPLKGFHTLLLIFNDNK